MNEKIEISRDKRNPTWAWVGDTIYDVTSKNKKRIIIDICDNGCIAVDNNCKARYNNNSTYSTERWSHFIIIKELTYRPFETIEEYIEATKDKKDLRIISKHCKKIINLDNVSEDSISVYFCECKYNAKEIFHDYLWLDDHSPVGVKE